ncbi:MAG TPA: hypothetical protein DGT23_34240 [Micromonosporaceae bacterium]|nr:hypothetical protein [Micromonosporaceae bacterium]
MVARVLAALALSAGLVAGLAACSSEGASTSCSTSECTITFDRSVADAKASVLGVEVVLVSATDKTVTLKVAGQEVTINNEQSATAGGLNLQLKSLSESQIVVEVSRA